MKINKKSLIMKIFFLTIAVILVFAFYVLWIDFSTKGINNFEECEEAGYSTRQINPQEWECKIPFGRRFAESILIASDLEQKINNNKEINYTKYYNKKYDLHFEYPANLDITKDESGSEHDAEGFWIVRMQTSDYNIQHMREAQVYKINAGMAIGLSINPNQAGMSGNNELLKDFEKLKELKRLGFGGPPIVKDEEIEKNDRKYFIQTFGKMYENNIRVVVSTMRKQGFVITFSVSGIDLYSEEINASIDKFMGTLKCN